MTSHSLDPSHMQRKEHLPAGRHLRMPLAFMYGCLVASLALPAHALNKGDTAPDLDVVNANGQKQTINLKEKLTYVDFWASWCGPCKQSFPWMNDVHARYAAQGLQVIAVNLDQKSADAQKFLSASPAKFAIAFDPKGATPRLYGVKTMPSSYLIDRNGKIIHVHAGFSADDSVQLEKQIRSALELKP